MFVALVTALDTRHIEVVCVPKRKANSTMTTETTTMASEAETARLVLVRHGETEWNVERRLQGHLDVDLNDVGRRQV